MFYVILYIYLAAVAFSFGCSLLSFRYPYPGKFKLFAIFLAMTLIIELLGNVVFTSLHIRGKYRNGMYNVFALVEFLFYAYFLYQVNTTAWIKKIQLGFMALFPIAWAVLIFDKPGLMAFHGAIIATGGFFIVCFALSYIYFLPATTETRNISRIPEFWISIGLIVFYCCETPYMGSMAYLVKYHVSLAESLLYLSMMINTLMYFLFGYAFICQKKNYS